MTEVRAYDDRDAGELKAFFARVPEGDRTFFHEEVLADEWHPDSADHRWIALDGSTVVGSLVIRPGVAWSNHVGELRIVVDPGRRRQGIGRTLARTALVEGISLDLKKMIVEIPVDDESTLAMFHANGFEAEALLKQHVRDSTGGLHDLIVMSHFVDDNWSTAETTGIADLTDDVAAP